MAGLDPIEIKKISVRQLETFSPEYWPRTPSCQNWENRLDMAVPQIPRGSEAGFNERHGPQLNIKTSVLSVRNFLRLTSTPISAGVRPGLLCARWICDRH